MILRAATADDVPALAALGRDSFIAKFGPLYRPEDLDAFLQSTFSDEAVAREMADPGRLYHLAEDAGGALTGYCKIALATSFPEYAQGARTMELKQLYTDPARTGAGIGAALMDWAMDEFRARGADEIHLSVWSENYGAQRFYQRYGFAYVADIDFWVGDQRDEDLLFALRL